MQKQPTPSEDSEQSALVIHLRAKGYLIFSVPNGGGKLGPVAGARLKRTGLLAGVPDLCLCLPSGRVVWIEMKKVGGRVSPEQKAVHAQLTALGHTVIVAHGAKEALAFLNNLLP